MSLKRLTLILEENDGTRTTFTGELDPRVEWCIDVRWPLRQVVTGADGSVVHEHEPGGQTLAAAFSLVNVEASST